MQYFHKGPTPSILLMNAIVKIPLKFGLAFKTCMKKVELPAIRQIKLQESEGQIHGSGTGVLSYTFTTD